MKNTPFFLALALLTSVGCSTATAPTINNGEQLDADVPLAGVTAGTMAGEVAAEVAGTTAGEVAGTTAGEVAGTTAGEVAGTTAGEVAGTMAGEVAGTMAGEVAGITAGEVAGTMAGEVAGTMAGEMAGEIAGIMAGEVAGITAGEIAGEMAGVMAGTTSEPEGGRDFSWLSDPAAPDITRFDAPCPNPTLIMTPEQPLRFEVGVSAVRMSLGENVAAFVGRAPPVIDQTSAQVRDQALIVYPAQVLPGNQLALELGFTVNDVVETLGLINDLAVSRVRGDDRLAVVARIGSQLRVIYVSLSERNWVSYNLELGTEQVHDLKVELGSRIHISARVNDQVKLWRIHPQTGAQERELSLGSNVRHLKTALNGDKLGLLYQDGVDWRWCVVSTINYNACPSLPPLFFITDTDDPYGVNLTEAKIDPRTWLISLAGGGMLRGLTIDEEGTLLNTGTLTLSSPYLANTPQLELERVVGGGFIASTVGDGQALQTFSLVPTVYPIEERGVWTVGANQNIDRADAVLISNVASRWGVVVPVTVMGDYSARLAELTCGP